jgi:hypothetical protein
MKEKKPLCFWKSEHNLSAARKQIVSAREEHCLEGPKKDQKKGEKAP